MCWQIACGVENPDFIEATGLYFMSDADSREPQAKPGGLSPNAHKEPAQRLNALGMVEHEERASVLGELHARPLLSLSVPRRIYHFAFMTSEDAAQEDRVSIEALAKSRGVPPPAAGAKFHRFDFGPWDLRWEQHTEFTTYTWSTSRDGEKPFEKGNPIKDGEFSFTYPGPLIVAVHMSVIEGDLPVSKMAAMLSSQGLCVIEASEGQARVATDFLVDPNGFTRFLIESRGMSERRTGRLAQRVLEIETYRTIALLGLPLARKVGPVLAKMERELSGITSDIAHARENAKSEALLLRLGELAAAIEAQSAQTGFRFGATRAYHDLVYSRLELIHEKPVGDNISISAFFDRRLVPAIETCNAVDARQERVSGQIARAADMLRTGIQFDLEQQNRSLLQSMDRRAKLQLRLQQTVEGLSVAAISYYVVGLITYLAKGLAEAGALPPSITPGIVTALAVPVVVAGMWFLMHMVRRTLHKDEPDPDHAAGEKS